MFFIKANSVIKNQNDSTNSIIDEISMNSMLGSITGASCGALLTLLSYTAKWSLQNENDNHSLWSLDPDAYITPMAIFILFGAAIGFLAGTVAGAAVEHRAGRFEQPTKKH